MDGGIKFDVSANTAKFEADMGRVKNSASTTAGAVGKAFSGLGGLFAGGALVAGLTSILRKMDDVSDMARRFGTTAVEIQKVGNAAEIVGTSVDAVARAMNRAGVAANKAAREGGSLAEAFARVDIDPAKFAAAGLEDRIKMVAEAQRAANGDAQKMADLFEVIGVKAAGINFAELVTEMEQVNAASNDTVESLAAANDQLDKMKQSATIFGGGLIKAVTNAGERLGSFLAGQGFKTISQLDQEQNLKNAEGRVRARGELLPDDSTMVKRQQFVGGPVPATIEERVLGPNAQENIRRINAELERMQKEADSAKKSMAGLSDEIEETDKSSASAQNSIDKQTQSLERQAKLAEETRQGKIRAYDTEIALTEARLAGNKALEDSILTQEDFNKVLNETGSFETAASVAHTRSLQRQMESEPGSGEKAKTATEQQPLTENQRVGELRGQKLSESADARAQELAGGRQYRSAIRAQDRGQSIRDAAMQMANVQDLVAKDYQVADLGKAYEKYKSGTGIMGRMSRQEFEDSIREKAKTPEQRQREKEDAAKMQTADKGQSSGGGGGSASSGVEGLLDTIISLMEKRLPIRVLA